MHRSLLATSRMRQTSLDPSASQLLCDKVDLGKLGTLNTRYSGKISSAAARLGATGAIPGGMMGKAHRRVEYLPPTGIR